MPLNDKDKADLAASLIASIPANPKKVVVNRCGKVVLVTDPAAVDLRNDAISVASELLNECP
jgi:hypothetical protein